MSQIVDKLPWYQRVYRWGQTNITEVDPVRYDISWWRQHWRQTCTQGVIINAAGIVAYYPSKFPLHHRAEYLGDRDIYGEVAAAARQEGLAVIARMDSNRTGEDFFHAHPDWFTRDKNGDPYRAGVFYIPCLNGPYYEEFLADVLREIIERSSPDGFADNSWSGLNRDRICYCVNCERKFHKWSGHSIPAVKNWDDPAYRAWIEWSYQCRLDLWDFNNRVTTEAGGPDCLWLGMNAASPAGQAHSFRDFKAIAERSKIMLLDSQMRSNASGFQSNADAGALIHGLLGWDKLIPESMAMYQGPAPTFRLASRPAAEARLWMVEGFAGTIQPWWHHIGAWHEDRRQYRTARQLMQWHEKNQEYLVRRTPVASVAVLWSQRNIDFYGRDHAEELAMLPYQGITGALLRARIPYIPMHIDDLDRIAGDVSVIILPNIAAMTDAQCESIRKFVSKGGALVATGETSLYDQWGDRRADFALADILGVHATEKHVGGARSGNADWEIFERHTYLRLIPALAGQAGGPKNGTEPAIDGGRHRILNGFEETDILPFGGRLEIVQVADSQRHIPLTFIPKFPIYPPETSWMRERETLDPALVVTEAPGRGSVAYLSADIDRCFARDNLPDHGDLLAGIVRFVGGGGIPLQVEGAGLIDFRLYRQNNRLIVHIVNLTNAGTWRAPVHELIPVGPLHCRIKLPSGVAGKTAQFLVAGTQSIPVMEDEWARFTIDVVFDHEVAVIY